MTGKAVRYPGTLPRRIMVVGGLVTRWWAILQQSLLAIPSRPHAQRIIKPLHFIFAIHMYVCCTAIYNIRMHSNMYGVRFCLHRSPLPHSSVRFSHDRCPSAGLARISTQANGTHASVQTHEIITRSKIARKYVA